MRWEGEAWVERREGLAEGESIRSVHATREGLLFGIGTDRREANQRILYQRIDGRWQRHSTFSNPGYLPFAFGRDWIARASYRSMSEPATLSVYRDGAWSELPTPGQDWEGVVAIANRLGTFLHNRLVFFDQGRWHPEALGAALAARGESRLEDAMVLSYDSDPLGLEGVRWYLLRSPERGLVGCRMHAGQVDCIGALEGHFDLTRGP